MGEGKSTTFSGKKYINIDPDGFGVLHDSVTPSPVMLLQADSLSSYMTYGPAS